MKKQKIPSHYIPFLRAIRAQGLKGSPQWWDSLRRAGRVQGARWGGYHWYLPPGPVVVLPGKTLNGRPRDS